MPDDAQDFDDEPELDDDTLEEDDEELELDDDVVAEVETDDVVVADDATETTTPAARPKKGSDEASDDEDDDGVDLEEELHPDDVEEPLDVLLHERTTTDRLEEEANELEDEDLEPDAPGEASGRVVPRRDDEFLCRSCFLVKPLSQLARRREGPLSRLRVSRAPEGADPLLPGAVAAVASGLLLACAFPALDWGPFALFALDAAAVGMATSADRRAPRSTGSSPASRSSACCCGGSSTSARWRSCRSSRPRPRTGPSPARSSGGSGVGRCARRGSPPRCGSSSRPSVSAGRSAASRGGRSGSRCTTSRSPAHWRALVACPLCRSSSCSSTGRCCRCSSRRASGARDLARSSRPS